MSGIWFRYDKLRFKGSFALTYKSRLRRTHFLPEFSPTFFCSLLRFLRGPRRLPERSTRTRCLLRQSGRLRIRPGFFVGNKPENIYLFLNKPKVFIYGLGAEQDKPEIFIRFLTEWITLEWKVFQINLKQDKISFLKDSTATYIFLVV